MPNSHCSVSAFSVAFAVGVSPPESAPPVSSGYWTSISPRRSPPPCCHPDRSGGAAPSGDHRRAPLQPSGIRMPLGSSIGCRVAAPFASALHALMSSRPKRGRSNVGTRSEKMAAAKVAKRGVYLNSSLALSRALAKVTVSNVVGRFIRVTIRGSCLTNAWGVCRLVTDDWTRGDRGR